MSICNPDAGEVESGNYRSCHHLPVQSCAPMTGAHTVRPSTPHTNGPVRIAQGERLKM
jgi:hypothetical protein